MKPNIRPTSQEYKLGNDDFIVSKTDTSGRITYANRIFMQIAGYSESALLGQQHNIIRHPDMPRGVFRFLWDTLKSGEEFSGFVKNMSADGGFYWVFANVTPDYDMHGKLQGYYSVRRKPPQSAIETIAPVYKEMLLIEKQSSAKEGPDKSIAYLVDVVKQSGARNFTKMMLDLYKPNGVL